METNKERIKELLEQAVALESEADDLLKGLNAQLPYSPLSAKLCHLAFLLTSTMERYEYLNATHTTQSNEDPL